jgi:hypothetical protein
MKKTHLTKSNKSSVTGRKPTVAEYFIDKKAINKNL